MNPRLKTTWHNEPAKALLDHFGVDADEGLTSEDALRRLASHGPNRLSARQGKGPIRLFLEQMNEPLIYILLFSGITTAFLGEYTDSSVIFGVVLVNALIGFFQESNALKAIQALARTLNVTASVLRGGRRHSLPAADLIPGDIIFLQSGDKVAADVRLLQTYELRIDESTLTGESIPVEKQPDVLPDSTILADRRNMAYSSTLVTYGTARALVVATGDQTEIGRINRMIADTEPLQTPLTRKMSRFSRLLLWLIIGFALVTFAVGVWRGKSMLDMFMASVALAVGAVPEGLPAALTITMAIGVARMARRNAIIRKLPAVETLGSTTVICTDKTGTLTQNQMTVQAIYAGREIFHVTGSGLDPRGDFMAGDVPVAPHEKPVLLECLKAGLLCNDTRLLGDPDRWQVDGDPTEAALLVAAHKAGLEHDQIREDHPRLDSIPFESQHRFMATLHRREPNDRFIYLKGSLEDLLSRCDSESSGDMKTTPLDRERLHRQAEALAAQGLRVLAFARMDHSDDDVRHDEVQRGLTFLGLQAMMDPPRPEAASAIAACQEAGIAVKMITGDHPTTALAIARQMGMGQRGVISGSDLETLNDAECQKKVEEFDVYARISPEQKLQLVQALQSNGHVVAMTGDGVNDAPALRQADIGVAMGMGGTDVAREAAAIVLTDDRFATIEAAVEEGRSVFDNLVKFIAWTLPTNLGEGLVITAAVFADVALPITPLQILWINMTTAVLLGLMLAFEPREQGLMLRRPRHPKQPIFTGRLLFRIVLVGFLLLAGAFGLFQWELSQGASLKAARTVAANVFVFAMLFYLFNCRSLHHSMFRIGLFSNPWVIFGVASTTLLQLLFTYWSPMQSAFGTDAIGQRDWLLILAVGVSTYGVIGLEKLLFHIFGGHSRTYH